jgi:N-acetylglucosaminyl-diphospho-decaprenol L-rhamnosyltransferase
VGADPTLREPLETITVVVVSWNTRDLLDRCLRSLQDCAEDGRAEVWVVDNASADGSAEVVRERHPWVRLIALDENLGYGRAVNLVAGQTRSRWFAFANADVALEPGALDRMVAAGESDPGAGIIAPRLVLPNGETQHLAWAFPTLAATVAQNLGPRVLPGPVADRLALSGAWDPERPRRVPWAVGALLLVRREAWDQIGGFDPEQWMSAEDLDLGWRMHVAGWATRYEPSAVVHHEESSATRSVWGDHLPIHWQRCAYAWMVRRRGRPRTAAVGLVNLGGSALRLALWTLVSRFRPDERVIWFRRWTLVHLYAFAPRRILARYR